MIEFVAQVPTWLVVVFAGYLMLNIGLDSWIGYLKIKKYFLEREIKKHD